MGKLLTISIINWEKFQHYKDRNPPWIKLYHSLLDNYEYSCLQDDSKLLLISLYMIAGRKNNKIPYDVDWIKSKAMIKGRVDIEPLINYGFIKINGDNKQLDSALLSNCYQNACLETETETETETEKGAEIKTFNLPSQEIINESSIPKIQTDLNKICDELYETKIFPEVHAFKNTMIKKGKNERTIIHTLSRCYLKKTFDKDGGPWAYCIKIINIEDGNFNERDYLKTVPASDPPF